MPTEGTAVFEHLQASLREAEQFMARCDSAAAEVDAQMRDLLAQRGQALLDLARHFLPSISRPAIESSFEGIRSDLMAILARKEQRQRELQGQRAQADEAIQRHEAEINQVTAQLNAKVAERERLEAQVSKTLESNADFQERSKLALQAEEQLHRNEQRVKQIQQQASEKLPHYDRSRLFRYLYDRGYGTSEYQARGIVLELDRWVAGLIRFGEARGGYEFLRKTPELVAAEVERRRTTFTELMQQVEALQKAEADKAGLTAVLQEGDQLGLRRDELVEGQDSLRQQAQPLQNGLAELEQQQNSFYSEAIERFRGFLGETRLALLEQRARQTPEPDDDAIVAEIARLDAQIDELKPRNAERADQRRSAAHLHEDLSRVVQRYRQANYDSSRSYFDDRLDLGQALAQLQAGNLDASGLWAALEATHQFRPHWVESTAQGAGQVLASPTGRILMGALVNIASHAMRDAAYRGIQRRSDVFFPPSSPSPDYSPAPAPEPPPVGDSPPEPSEGSFTTGDGF